jgi:hypothetical protein
MEAGEINSNALTQSSPELLLVFACPSLPFILVAEVLSLITS